jgi:hypothetical protein
MNLWKDSGLFYTYHGLTDLIEYTDPRGTQDKNRNCSASSVFIYGSIHMPLAYKVANIHLI